MTPSEITRILSAPISILRRATPEERTVFSRKKDGLFYLFGLASGQRFVAYVPVDKQIYIFRPIRNFLPGLKEIVWKKTEAIEDLGYGTFCSFTKGASPEFRKACLAVLKPTPDNTPGKPLTKIAFRYYHIHPMLERSCWLQLANLKYEESRLKMLASKTVLKSLMISKKNNNLNQQQKGEQQNVRN